MEAIYLIVGIIIYIIGIATGIYMTYTVNKDRIKKNIYNKDKSTKLHMEMCEQIINRNPCDTQTPIFKAEDIFKDKTINTDKLS